MYICIEVYISEHRDIHYEYINVYKASQLIKCFEFFLILTKLMKGFTEIYAGFLI